MMNSQLKVIPPAILKIATLIDFCTSFYIICLYAFFCPTFINMFSFLSLPCMNNHVHRALLENT